MKQETMLAIRIDKKLRENLKVAAIRNDDTVQNVVTNLIIKYLEEEGRNGHYKTNSKNNDRSY